MSDVTDAVANDSPERRTAHEADVRALTLARALVDRSHAPYSEFRAASVVMCDDGTSHGGVIVENVSLGLAMCAERVAMFNAVTNGARPILVAFAAPTTSGATTWPCGPCLQVALELGGPSMRVVVGDVGDGESDSATVGELLPRGPHVRRERT